MTGTRSIHNLALIGFMGTGKSCVGRVAADLMHFTFLDTDHVIEARAGKAISDIFAQDGEPAFRQWERKIVEELARLDKTVIATGGGLPADPANLASLKTHALVICLWASPEAIWERLNEIPTGAEEIFDHMICERCQESYYTCEVIGMGHRWIVSVILALSVLGILVGFWIAEFS